jgi:hypothetical protein
MTAVRRPGAASAAVLVGLSLSLAAAHLIAPDWSRDAGLDVWNLPELNRAGRAAAEEQAALDANAERARRRVEAADHVALRLLDGALALPAAANELAVLFREERGTRVALELSHSGVTDLRRLFARHAIDRVARLLADDPSRRADVLARLEGEYRAMGSGE